MASRHPLPRKGDPYLTVRIRTLYIYRRNPVLWFLAEDVGDLRQLTILSATGPVLWVYVQELLQSREHQLEMLTYSEKIT